MLAVVVIPKVTSIIIIGFVIAVAKWVTSAECVDKKPAGTVHQHIMKMLLALNLGKGSITPTPTIIMHMATCHGQVNIDILPDWGGGTFVMQELSSLKHLGTNG